VTTVRLLADDLTGALDTAAEFVPLTGPIRVAWHGAIPDALPASAALDSGTREAAPDEAAAVVTALTPYLRGAGIAYKKIDSLLRGPTLAELAACLRAGPWRACLLAPAFPDQGRITVQGVQLARDAGGVDRVAGDILAGLRGLGAAAQTGCLAGAPPDGISVFDARSNQDLRRIAAYAAALAEPLLLAGTGGLAQAMAAGAPAVLPPRLVPPILGLFGSDQAATAAQLAACGAYHVRVPEAGAAAAAVARLHQSGIALVSLDLPNGLSRPDAARRIATAFNRVTGDAPRPGTLVVSGGETLRALCAGLDAHGLDVFGRLQPGVPLSRLRGGRWDGVTIVSKSGAFGGASLLRDHLLLHERSA
jgi:D-threonate/D-erythronate kinase